MQIIKINLTHSFPVHPFSIPWKHQKTLWFRRPEDYQKSRDEVETLNPPSLNWDSSDSFATIAEVISRHFPKGHEQLFWVPTTTFFLTLSLFCEIMSLTHFNTLLHLIKKPVIWFAVEIKWLVSIWNAIYMKRNTGLKWISISKKIKLLIYFNSFMTKVPII